MKEVIAAYLKQQEITIVCYLSVDRKIILPHVITLPYFPLNSVFCMCVCVLVVCLF